jgi:transcriptional regulator with XRE-family HTH domain
MAPTTEAHSATTAEAVPKDGRGSVPGALFGDLARRVTHRRTELGMTTEDLAHRAGVDAWFLTYFEHSADTTLTPATLLRLAIALDTTPLLLQGGDVDRAPGIGRPGMNPALEELSAEECMERLTAGGVGRIVLSTESGPEAYPVNFVLTGGDVVFRTSSAMVARIHGVVAFEVDRIDETMRSGWSVLVRGRARLIDLLGSTPCDPEPWAGGPRRNLVGITPFELTGRTIVSREQLARSRSTHPFTPKKENPS